MLRKLGTAALVVASLLAFGQDKKARNKRRNATPPAAAVDTSTINYREFGAPLPPFRIVTAQGKSITDTIANSGGNFFLMLFNPTCEHCEEMTHRLGEASGLFKKSRIALVAAKSMMPYLEYFDQVTKYSSYPVLNVGIDSSFLIDRTYGYYSLPQINIYSPDRRLIHRFTGETPIDSLKPYIQ